MMPRKSYGFTLLEMLIVVAIIAVLVATAIPIFANQLEKSREAADLANVRSAYAVVLSNAMLGYEDPDDIEKVVQLQQKQDGFQGFQDITIGDVSDKDKARWIGQPQADGVCAVYYDEELNGIILDRRLPLPSERGLFLLYKESGRQSGEAARLPVRFRLSQEKLLCKGCDQQPR